MPRLKSAIKRDRLYKKYRIQNLWYKTAIKTLIKKVSESVAKKDYEGAVKLKNEAFSLIDKAKCKGVVHLNYAAKRKSRIAKWLKTIEPETKKSTKSKSKS